MFQAEDELRQGEESKLNTNTETDSDGQVMQDLMEPLHEARELDKLDSGDSVLNVSCSSCSDLGAVELSLAEAERKIAKLLRVKEKLVAVEVS